MTVDFENTMVKDPFKYNPLFSLSHTTMSICCCNCSSVSAIITVSSAYLKLCITVTPTLKPPFPSMFLMIISVYIQMRRGDTTVNSSIGWQATFCHETRCRDMKVNQTAMHALLYRMPCCNQLNM